MRVFLKKVPTKQRYLNAVVKKPSRGVCSVSGHFLQSSLSVTERKYQQPSKVLLVFDEIDSDVKSITYLLFNRTELFDLLRKKSFFLSGDSLPYLLRYSPVL